MARIVLTGIFAIFFLVPLHATPHLLSVANNNIIASVDVSNRHVVIWRGQGSKSSLKIDIPGEQTAVQLTATGDLVAVGDKMGGVTICNTTTGDRVVSFTADDSSILRLAFFQNDQLIAYLSSDGTVGVWSVPKQANVWKTMSLSKGWSGSLVISHDERLIAVSVNSSGYLVDASTGVRGKFISGSPVGFLGDDKSIYLVDEFYGYWSRGVIRSVPDGNRVRFVQPPHTPEEGSSYL